MRKVAIVITSDNTEIAIVANENESIEDCLDRKKIDWVKYLPIN